MVAKNPITGDDLRSKSTTDAYRDNWDRIFKKKVPEPVEVVLDEPEELDHLPLASEQLDSPPTV